MAIELTDKELSLAKANINYALENCPVEGGVMTEDGRFSTKESFESLLKKLQSVDVKPLNQLDVNNKELELMIAAANYAHEFC